MQGFWKNYFVFNRKERRAVIILLILLCCFIALPYLYHPPAVKPFVNKDLQRFLEERVKEKQDLPGYAQPETVDNSKLPQKLFYFDPNMATAHQWQLLGVRKSLSKTILHYLEKGGRFRKAADLYKIWGMQREIADELIPYVRIATNQFQQKTVAAKFYTQTKPGGLKAGGIDINTASADDWKSLPGIGEVLAARIIRYRQKMGVFRSVEQVGKTYGLTDTVFVAIKPFLRIDSAFSSRINLNRVSADRLQELLYLSPGIAQSIVLYRKQQGAFERVADLKKLILISDTMYQRISPLLEIKQP